MLNWREIPFVRLLLSFSVGILLAIKFEQNMPGLPLVFIGLMGLMVLSTKLRGLYRYRWVSGALLKLAMLILGYGITWQHNELNNGKHFSKICPPEQGTALVGKITEAPIQKENWVKLELGIQGAGPNADGLRPASGNLLLYLQRDSFAEGLAYGDKLVLQCKVISTSCNNSGNSQKRMALEQKHHSQNKQWQQTISHPSFRNIRK